MSLIDVHVPNYKKRDLNSSESVMTPNQKYSVETITIKKLSNKIRSKTLKKDILKHKLRKDYKNHMLLTQQNDAGAFHIEFLIRKTSCKDVDKISKSDPKPRWTHARKLHWLLWR